MIAQITTVAQGEANHEPRRWRRVAAHVVHALVWAAVVYVLARQIFAHWSELSAFTITIRPLFLTAAFAGILLHKGLYGYAWYVWIHPYQPAARRVPSMASYFVSALLNYLPGAVWPALWLARINRDGDAADDPRGRNVGTVMSYLQHQVLGIAAAAVTLGISAIFASLSMPPWLRASSIAAGLGASLILLPGVRARSLAILATVLRRPAVSVNRQGRLSPVLVLMMTGNFIASGWFHLFILALFPSFETSYMNVVFIAFAAQFATHLAIGIPSGLGVRELALTLLLQRDNLMTAPAALVVAVLLRLFVIIADIALPAVFVYPWLRLRKR
jgi:hypothetical protein